MEKKKCNLPSHTFFAHILNSVINFSSKVTLKIDSPPRFLHQELYPCHGNTTYRLQACLWTQSWLSLHFQVHKYKYSLVDIFLNAKCRRFKLQRILLLLLLAIATELVPSSHGQFFVGAPNGSPPVPRNVCQNATLNLNQSYDCPKIQSQTINCLINSKLIREKNQPSFSSLEFPLPHYTIWRIGGSC